MNYSADFFGGLWAGRAVRICSTTSGEYMAVVPTIRTGLIPAFFNRAQVVFLLRLSTSEISVIVSSSIIRKVTDFKSVVKKYSYVSKVFIIFLKKI